MNKVLVCFLLLASTAAGFAAKDEPITDMETAIQQAATEKKALFIIFGRENCGNCRNLREMIDDHRVRLSKSSFLIANINCDDATQYRAFKKRYNVEGPTRPFVVIAKSDGTMVASRTGGGSEKTYDDFVRDAKKELKDTSPAGN